jgi:hypothetical protein
VKINHPFNNTDQVTANYSTPINLQVPINSFCNHPDSISRPIGFSFNVTRNEIFLDKQNKSAQNEVLRRQNFTTFGMSYIENFLNITGPIFDMYVALSTNKSNSAERSVLTG